MARFLRILLLTLLIGAIVFFAFRANQPITKLKVPDHDQVINTTANTATDSVEEKTKVDGVDDKDNAKDSDKKEGKPPLEDLLKTSDDAKTNVDTSVSADTFANSSASSSDDKATNKSVNKSVSTPAAKQTDKK